MSNGITRKRLQVIEGAIAMKGLYPEMETHMTAMDIVHMAAALRRVQDAIDDPTAVAAQTIPVAYIHQALEGTA